HASPVLSDVEFGHTRSAAPSRLTSLSAQVLIVPEPSTESMSYDAREASQPVVLFRKTMIRVGAGSLGMPLPRSTRSARPSPFMSKTAYSLGCSRAILSHFPEVP